MGPTRHRQFQHVFPPCLAPMTPCIHLGHPPVVVPRWLRDEPQASQGPHTGMYSTVTVSPGISQPPREDRGQATTRGVVFKPDPTHVSDVGHPVVQRRQGRLSEWPRLDGVFGDDVGGIVVATPVVVGALAVGPDVVGVVSEVGS